MTDCELLRRYTAANDHEAFAVLVRRHLDWVYSTCRRQVRDPDLAQDVTQVVFLTLARKAAILSPATSISGWLFTTSRYAVATALRMERRRRHHEHEAALMRPQSAPQESDRRWQEIEPILDEALAHLPASDRQAIILRYFQGLSNNDLGQTLGITEQAAQKRVTRALERLRGKLASAATLTPSLIAALLTENATHAAPPALVQASAAAPASIAAAKIEAILKGVLLMQKATALKFAAGVALAVLLFLGAATFITATYLRSAPVTHSAPVGGQPIAAAVPALDLQNVQTIVATGTNDAGDSITAIVDRQNKSVLRGTYPYGKIVHYFTADGDFAFHEGKFLILRKNPPKNLMFFTDLEALLKSLAQADPVREPAEDAIVNGIACQAYRINGGKLAGGLAFLDPQSERILRIKDGRSKMDEQLAYDPPLPPDTFTIPSGPGIQVVDMPVYFENQYPVKGAVFTSKAAGFLFAVHEIQQDAAGRFMVVCSSRIDPDYRSTLKEVPDNVDLGGFSLPGGEPAVELGRIEQSGVRIAYFVFPPHTEGTSAGHLRFSVRVHASENLLAQGQEVPAEVIVPVDIDVKGQQPASFRAFAASAFDAVDAVVGLMARTNLTFSRPLGSAIPEKEEYLNAAEEKVARELPALKRP